MRNLIKTSRLLISMRSSLITNLLILAALLFSQKLFSQQLSDTSEEFNRRNFKEDLFVRTDRDIYISGEQVWFKVYKLGGLNHSPNNISKVVYLELLDKNNLPLRQLKVKTDYSSCSYGFSLPDNISSGNYIIRAYTNWMQNFSADQFFYRTISVINPFESIDHLKLPSINRDVDSVRSHSIALPQSLSGSQVGNQDKMNSTLILNKEQINYTINLEHQQYSTRGKVKLMISATDRKGNPVETDLSVSVTRTALVTSSSETSFHNLDSTTIQFGRIAHRDYLAELEGHLINGHIRLKTTDEPLKNIDISLSFVGKAARCRFGKTDENGEFNFVVKESGLNEIVIQPLSQDITGYYIELTQPFSSSFSDIKPVDFYIDSSKINEINKAIVGMQVTNIYDPFREKPGNETKSVIPDFYGKPENTIKMSDYIELTSLREVVKEIIPDVYTLKQNGKYDFKLINKFRGQPFENKPLVLVDGVPVYDFEKVLGINSKEIERADVINTRYFFADNVFDGIVSFITKKGNLSVMDFDNSIFRQVYEGSQSGNNFSSPVYSTGSIKDSHIPDFRNTLFWKPDLHTGKDGNTDIEFFTSDESTEYKIVVEGITSDGKTGYSSSSFIVK